MDAELRTAQRGDRVAWLTARLRAGTLSRERLEVAAFAGDEAARALCPNSWPQIDAEDWVWWTWCLEDRDALNLAARVACVWWMNRQERGRDYYNIGPWPLDSLDALRYVGPGCRDEVCKALRDWALG